MKNTELGFICIVGVLLPGKTLLLVGLFSYSKGGQVFATEKDSEISQQRQTIYIYIYLERERQREREREREGEREREREREQKKRREREREREI